MRLASFTAEGRDRFGIVTATGLVDVSARVQAPDLKTVIGLGPRQLGPFANAPSDWGFDDVAWLPPITNPTHVIGIGLNTKSHFAETAELMRRVPGDYPKYPRLFMRSPLSHVGHGRPIVIPEVSTELDYEGEIALIIGRPCRGVTVQEALDYIAGYACYNDGSVRDFQMHSNQVTAGKNFVASGAFGPWIATADEVPEQRLLTLRTRVNGEVRQQLETADLIFGFGELVAYISQIYELRPGDVILTGSPAGIGALSQNWLKAGDRVEIEIPAVGTLGNTVVSSEKDAA